MHAQFHLHYWFQFKVHHKLFNYRMHEPSRLAQSIVYTDKIGGDIDLAKASHQPWGSRMHEPSRLTQYIVYTDKIGDDIDLAKASHQPWRSSLLVLCEGRAVGERGDRDRTVQNT